jgi:hypothetical protein
VSEPDREMPKFIEIAGIAKPGTIDSSIFSRDCRRVDGGATSCYRDFSLSTVCLALIATRL